jgi:hypothetical protein
MPRCHEHELDARHADHGVVKGILPREPNAPREGTQMKQRAMDFPALALAEDRIETIDRGTVSIEWFGLQAYVGA